MELLVLWLEINIDPPNWSNLESVFTWINIIKGIGERPTAMYTTLRLHDQNHMPRKINSIISVSPVIFNTTTYACMIKFIVGFHRGNLENNTVLFLNCIVNILGYIWFEFCNIVCEHNQDEDQIIIFEN